MKLKKYRINGFTQIHEFYKIIFNGKLAIKPEHIAVYFFILNQDNRANWSEWICISIDTLMIGTTITRVQTVYKILADLESWKLIEWQRGTNKYQAAKYKLLTLTKSARLNVPLSARVNATLPASLYALLSDTLPETLPQIIYKQLMDKLYKSLNDNIELIKTANYLIQIRKK